jgi:hypothetical protein
MRRLRRRCPASPAGFCLGRPPGAHQATPHYWQVWAARTSRGPVGAQPLRLTRTCPSQGSVAVEVGEGGGRRQARELLTVVTQLPAVTRTKASRCQAVYAGWLLAGHGHTHLRFGVGDEVAGHVDGDGVERPGEPERGLVVGGDRGAGVGAAGEPAGVECYGRGDRELVLGDELAVDVQLRPARRAGAVGDVGLAGGLELEPQLVPSCRKRVRCGYLALTGWLGPRRRRNGPVGWQIALLAAGAALRAATVAVLIDRARAMHRKATMSAA